MGAHARQKSFGARESGMFLAGHHAQRDELAEAADASSSSSTFTNSLGFLRGIGLLDYPTTGEVAASGNLFV